MWRKGGKRVGKKGMKRRVVRRRRANLRSKKAGGVEFASAKQTVALSNDPAGAIFRLDDVSLSAFDRLSQIARAYQYFRITKIEMKFKPFEDTFVNTSGTGSTGSVPYFHYLVMKSDTLNSITNGFNGLRDAGAKPIRFDDKTVTVKWRPTVAQGVALSEPNITTSYASYRTSPWLSTNANVMIPGGITTWAPSTVPHLGLLYGVEQDLLNPIAVLQYGVDITVYCQFKKPLNFTNGNGVGEAAHKKDIIAKDA